MQSILQIYIYLSWICQIRDIFNLDLIETLILILKLIDNIYWHASAQKKSLIHIITNFIIGVEWKDNDIIISSKFVPVVLLITNFNRVLKFNISNILGDYHENLSCLNRNDHTTIIMIFYCAGVFYLDGLV